VWVCCEMAITAGREMQLEEKEKKDINQKKKKKQSRERKGKIEEKNLVTLHSLYFSAEFTSKTLNEQSLMVTTTSVLIVPRPQFCSHLYINIKLIQVRNFPGIEASK